MESNSIIMTKQFLEQYYRYESKYFFIVSLSLKFKTVKQKKIRKPNGFDFDSKLNYFIDRNIQFKENVYFTLLNFRT